MSDPLLATVHQELRAAGASEAEARDLVPIAFGLRRMSLRQVRSEPPCRSIPLVGLAAAFGITLGVAMLVVAQTVLPGNWLYPVQRLSDRAAITLYPQYRGIVMMRRAQDVKSLIDRRASSQLVLATLADYSAEAATYKATSNNYAAFEFCKTSLQQAAAVAPDSERQAIDQALQSLEDV